MMIALTAVFYSLDWLRYPRCFACSASRSRVPAQAQAVAIS
jgi:hypothetical protein